MRKVSWVFVATVLIALAALPANAAEMKYTGIFRFRGVSFDDADRNDRNHDGTQFGDFLARPRWTAISEGGKIWAIYELDVFSETNSNLNGNFTFGSSTSRLPVGVNRFVVDAAIPGTTLRFRWGKTDWTDPTNEVVAGGAGLNRIQGYGTYGKIYGPVSINLWTVKYQEGKAAAQDGDLWHLAVNWKVAPSIEVIPWVMVDHRNGASDTVVNESTSEFDIQWYAVTVKAKYGIVDLSATGVYQDGEVNFSRGVNAAGFQDIDIEAWAALIRLWLTFGKLKIGFYGHFFSGDDDDTDNRGLTNLNDQRGRLMSRQPDNKLTRFSAARQNRAARLIGPQLLTRRRYSTIAVFGAENRPGGGNGQANMNGSMIYELLARYQVTKDLDLMGNLSVIRSEASRANIDACFDGDFNDSAAANAAACGNNQADRTFDSAKDFGVEIDLSARYFFYRSLFTRLTFSYLVAGDYGKASTIAGSAADSRDLDDTWALFFEFRHFWGT